MRLSTATVTGPEEFRFKIPDGFVLLQDTREQRPLFDGSVEIPGLTVVNTALVHGDYSIKGFEDRFCIERKGVSDFYAYVGKQRALTTVKMEAFKKIVFRGGFVGLVIEATEADLLAGYIMSRLSPEMVRQALVSFEVRTGVHIYYSRSRQDITRWILDRAIKFYKIKREVTL